MAEHPFEKPDIAEKLAIPLEWKDLILPRETHDLLDKIVSHLKFQKSGVQNFGFKEDLASGIKAFFSGPSGTGKTTAACLVASSCGLDIYSINLSELVSKYIGETEKNLAMIFDWAQAENWVLFFDEADSLFGKRHEVTDTHERYQNLEANFFLQRAESYPGLIILSSNHKNSLDGSSLRRFNWIVEFDYPDPIRAYRIWQMSIPIGYQLDPEVNLKQFSSDYLLTGGSIVNVVQYACGKCEERGDKVIALDDLEVGIQIERERLGKD